MSDFTQEDALSGATPAIGQRFAIPELQSVCTMTAVGVTKFMFMHGNVEKSRPIIGTKFLPPSECGARFDAVNGAFNDIEIVTEGTRSIIENLYDIGWLRDKKK